MIAVTETEINALVGRLIDNPGPQWPGMTYEQGIRAALDWVLEGSNHPLDDT